MTTNEFNEDDYDDWIAEDWKCADCGGPVTGYGGGGSKREGHSVGFECLDCGTRGVIDEEPRAVLGLGSKTFRIGNKTRVSGLEQR